MDDESKDIIDLHLKKDNEGEARYTYDRRTSRSFTVPDWLIKMAGIALGIVFFLVLAVFFIYVALPLLAVLLLWALLKNIFSSR